MRTTLFACMMFALIAGHAFADVASPDAAEPFQLTSYEAIDSACQPLPPLGNAASCLDSCCEPTRALRWYIAPILGASWLNLELPDGDIGYSRRLMTAGGAVGVALKRPFGQWRLETEGRYRDSFEITQPGITGALDITSNWIAMGNLWRDIPITQKLDMYAGGGLGVGGYEFSDNESEGGITLSGSSVNTAFAWQVGIGMAYELTKNISLDLGYRYYTMDDTVTNVTVSPGGSVLPVRQQLDTSELLFQVRIYEPFRCLRR